MASSERFPSEPLLTVLMGDAALAEFLAAAVREYRLITPRQPVPCFALLLGTVDGAEATVERVAFGRNVRACDPAAVEEFAEEIVPGFGTAYENETRGWWVDPRDLLRTARAAEAEGLEILGSIHMHPDWHRIGPPQERGLVLSERPTPMDSHVFRSTGWPVNLICYLERRGDVIYHALAGWAPQDAGDGSGCPELPLRVRTHAGAGVC